MTGYKNKRRFVDADTEIKKQNNQFLQKEIEDANE